MEISVGTATRRKISIMTPCFNEEANVAICYEAVRDYFKTELPEYDYEHIFIDNASQDTTISILRKICIQDARVKVIINTRNYGPHRSPYYGLLQMSGDAVIPIMCDLQTPVSYIGVFVRKWEEGFKLVLATRKKTINSVVLRVMRAAYYKLISAVSEVEQIPNFIGFGLFDRQVIDIIRSMDDSFPYFRGVVNEVGFEKFLVPYDAPDRLRGKSKQKWSDLFEYAIVGLTYSSRLPLRIVTLSGFVIGAITFVIGLIYLISKLLFWNLFSIGLAPVLLGIFFLGSVQIVFLGFVAEYVGMTFERVRHRPLVIERERINF
ncbi:glycosyltransferase family 2 protein [Roseixanthobacter glucoisosaccharinicivorans]|uniref:glycosyltransferase family 2 protein n=1 Tax=Roseixanthobacter glucoisosaccharinicivorans TaxID=3119923 RepID=UPI00372C26C1